MKNKRTTILIIGLVVFGGMLTVLLSGCKQQATSVQPDGQETPVSEPEPEIVRATGIVIPRREATLSFSLPGMVADILVERFRRAEHRIHVGYIRSVPTADILVERFRTDKHKAHVGDVGRIPAADVLVERRRGVEHRPHAGDA